MGPEDQAQKDGRGQAGGRAEEAQAQRRERKAKRVTVTQSGEPEGRAGYRAPGEIGERTKRNTRGRPALDTTQMALLRGNHATEAGSKDQRNGAR